MTIETSLSLFGWYLEYRSLILGGGVLSFILLLSFALYKGMGEFNPSRGKVVISLLVIGIILFVPATLIINSSFFTKKPATVFVLDQTDGFDEGKATTIKNWVLNEIDSTKGDSDIYFYEIGKFDGELQAIAEYKIPPRRKVFALLDSVPEEEAKKDEQNYQIFRRGVETSLNQLVGNFVSPSSYILEGVSFLVKNRLPLITDRSIRLVIISDLLQNSNKVEFYKKEILPFEVFTKTEGGILFSTDDFSGKQVTMYFVDRPFYEKNPAKKILVKNFWHDYFMDNGAYKVNVVGAEQ